MGDDPAGRIQDAATRLFAEHGFAGQDYFPEHMERQIFYRPVERGFEREIIKRLEYWNKLRKAKGG